MKKLMYSVNSLAVVYPIIFIEWKYIDRVTVAFAAWTFAAVYYMQRIKSMRRIREDVSNIYSRIAAISVQTAYLFAALDVRFIHLSDKILIKERYNAVVIYAILTVANIFLYEVVYLDKYQFKSICFENISSKQRYILEIIMLNISNIFSNKKLFAGAAYLISSTMLIYGQIALNSRISILLIFPAVLMNLLKLTDTNSKCCEKAAS